MPEHHESAESEPVAEKVVPVAEAVRYRKRAQLAERQLAEAQAELEALKRRADEAQQTITHLERRQQIDAQLAELDSIDVEAARLLTERAVMEMDEPDVRLAVEDLHRHKPYLFRHRRDDTLPMPARLPDQETDEAQLAAERAAETGHRRDLLAYLRLRRQT